MPAGLVTRVYYHIFINATGRIDGQNWNKDRTSWSSRGANSRYTYSK